MEKIKYIENNPVNGIKYNHKKIIKKYKTLGVPKEYDYTNFVPFENPDIIWYNLNSERSVGKTTNILLYGMCMYVMYGTVIQLIRHTIAMASYYRDLFNTIVAYNNGQYIKRLTDNKYNSVYYYQRRFYFAEVDEHGKVIDKDENFFCIALESDDCYKLCSTYECPTGDFIVLDECFNDRNRPEEFLHFIHLHKTIVRERISDKIFILGNNLDINNIWYRQLTIQQDVRRLKKGESKIITTKNGMQIFVAFLDNLTPKRRERFNKLHYDFNDNPELNAIVGNGWNMKMYPLTCELKERREICRGIYFSYHDELFLEGAFIDTFSGQFFEVHPANYKSAITGDIKFTLHFAMYPNEIYFGNDKLSRKIINYINSKRVVYSDNETGDLFEKFIREALA